MFADGLTSDTRVLPLFVVVAAAAPAVPAATTAAAVEVVVVVEVVEVVVVAMMEAVHGVFEHASAADSSEAHVPAAGLGFTAECDTSACNRRGDMVVILVFDFAGAACAEVCKRTATQFIAAC